MNTMTEKLDKSAAAVKETRATVPKNGDHFRCEKCGMQIEITIACKCEDPDHVHFQCCG